MAFFTDLSSHTYTPTCGFEVVNVGWLDEGNAFVVGPTPRDFMDALRQLCERPIHLHRGVHACWFCRRHSGNGQIRVPDDNGIWYAAPTLIYHYVADHQYLPPAEFIEAVLWEAARQRLAVCVASAMTGAVWAKVRVPK